MSKDNKSTDISFDGPENGVCDFTCKKCGHRTKVPILFENYVY